MTPTSSIPAISGASAAAAAASSSVAESADAVSRRFMTLLVTQLKNQDPLNPLDNAQITSQLAQLSTVTGINQLNGTLTALSASFDARQYLEATNLVGHVVVADGNAMTLADGKATGAIELPAAADRVIVSVTDAAGQVVRQIDLGAAGAGITTFDWDGASDAGVALKDGKYTLSINATSSGTTVAATALAVGTVKGLIPGAGGGTLNVDGVGPIGLAAIRQIS